MKVNSFHDREHLSKWQNIQSALVDGISSNHSDTISKAQCHNENVSYHQCIMYILVSNMSDVPYAILCMRPMCQICLVCPICPMCLKCPMCKVCLVCPKCENWSIFNVSGVSKVWNISNVSNFWCVNVCNIYTLSIQSIKLSYNLVSTDQWHQTLCWTFEIQ